MYDLQSLENRIMYLARQKGLSKNKLLINAQINKSLFDNMKKGQIPSIEKIHILADYLNCPVDYLLGRGLFKDWDLIIEHKEQIVTNLEDIYPFLKDYHLSDLPESSLMSILPSVIHGVALENNQIKIYLL